MNQRRDHYSYTVYADPQTARAFDQGRFGGPIGELIARDQAEVIFRFLGSVAGLSVLDVGTGTGRAALLLAEAGARVTGVDPSAAMLGVARERARAEHASIDFLTGDAHSLAFPDRSFDLVISLRVLMHTPRWRVCLSELCRVARDRVLIDHPAAFSASTLQAGLRRVAYMLGRPTQPYRVLSDRAVARALHANQFEVVRSHRHFALPIGVHKIVGSVAFTRTSERFLDRVQLRPLIGSPVTVLAKRCASS